MQPTSSEPQGSRIISPATDPASVPDAWRGVPTLAALTAAHADLERSDGLTLRLGRQALWLGSLAVARLALGRMRETARSDLSIAVAGEVVLGSPDHAKLHPLGAAVAVLRTTYSQTTPESATVGDYSEHGWVAADGHSLHPSNGDVGPQVAQPGHPWRVGRDASAVVLRQGEDDPGETLTQFAARVAEAATDRAWGCDHAQREGDGLSVAGYPSTVDYRTGTDENRTAHVEASPLLAALVLAALKEA